MDLRTALLLPGQGAYRPGALADMLGAPVTELLDTVDAVAAEFGRPGVSALLRDTDAPDARRLAAADPFALQLAIYATALAHAAVADRRQRADVVLGHSMGEMAAAAHAGCFTVADGARIAAHRAEALEQTAAGSGGMLAVQLSARRAEALLAAAERPGSGLAVINAPRHAVLSGPEPDLGELAALADVLRVRAVRLPAPYPFHNPLLAPARAAFAAAIEDIPQRAATTQLYSPGLGRLVTGDTDVKGMLVAQLTSPVDFLAAVRDLQTYGLETVVECGRAGLSAIVAAAGCAAAPVDRLPDGVAETAETAELLERPGARSAEPPPGPVPVTAPAPPDGDDVLAALQRIYAERLGYPIEAMDPDADLEGDLGIDSLKRMEILSSLVDRFGLQHVADDTRFALQSTLSGLARLILETGRGAGSNG